MKNTTISRDSLGSYGTTTIETSDFYPEAQTIGNLWEFYWTFRGRECKTAEKMQRMWRDYVSQFAERDLYSLRKIEVITWHRRLTDNHGPAAANHGLELLCSIYNHALQSGLIECLNPASNIRKNRVESRTRYLSQEECERLLAAVDALKNRTTRDYFYVLLLTGQRKGNVQAMRWDQLDLKNRVWNIPETKNGESHTVPLIEPVVAILTARLKRRTRAWVFPGNSRRGHIGHPQMAWSYILSRSGLENLRIHDLRRTMASWLAITGSELPIVARLLAHKDYKSTMIYTKLNTAPLRESLERGAMALTGQTFQLCQDTPIERAAAALSQENDCWVSELEAAEIIGINRCLLSNARQGGYAPPYLQHHHKVMYRLSDVRAWERMRAKQPRRQWQRCRVCRSWMKSFRDGWICKRDNLILQLDDQEQKIWLSP